MQRFARHRDFADRVMSRHTLARHTASMPPLARFLGLAPERGAAPRWAAFQPRAVRAAAPNISAASLGDEAAWMSEIAAPMLHDPDPPRAADADGAPAVLPPPRDAAWESHADIAPASPAAPTDRPPAPVGESPVAQPRSASQGQDTSRPSSPPVASPRARMGGRISEMPQRPRPPHDAAPMAPSVADPPAADASMPAALASVPVERAEAELIDDAPPGQETARDDAERPPISEPEPPLALPAVQPVESAGSATSAARDEPVAQPDLPARDIETAEPTPIAGMQQEGANQSTSPRRIGGEREQPARFDARASSSVSPPTSPEGVSRAVERETPGEARPAAIADDDRSASAAPESIRAADLFMSSEIDRSPAAWVARLSGTAQAQPAPEDAAPIEREDTPVQPVAFAPEAAAPDHPGATALTPAASPPTPDSGRAAPMTKGAPERTDSPPSPTSSLPEPPRAAGRQSPEIAPIAAAGSADPPLPSRGDDSASPAGVATVAGTAGTTPAVAASRDASLPPMPAPVAEPTDEGPMPERRADAGRPAPEAAIDATDNRWTIDPTEVIRPELLFQSPGADRSPAAWMARLTGKRPADATAPPHAIEETPPPPPGVGATEPSTRAHSPQLVAARSGVVGADAGTTPLPETARRFLRPLVGIDPASAPLSRDARATEVTAAYRADAVTDGNVTLLAAGNDDESPETLGLIAHELTHVARRRDPQFIPPIARAADRDGAPFAGATSTAGATVLLEDDEAVARRVERRVVRAARAYRAAEGGTPRLRADVGDRAGAVDNPGDGFAPEPPRAAHIREPDEWNGLPAPWEPLPDWMDTPAPVAATETTIGGAAMAGLALPPVAPIAQRAGEERPTEGESATPSPAPRGPHPPVEADLDALARQVYGILKRRLALERRSAG